MSAQDAQTKIYKMTVVMTTPRGSPWFLCVIHTYLSCQVATQNWVTMLLHKSTLLCFESTFLLQVRNGFCTHMENSSCTVLHLMAGLAIGNTGHMPGGLLMILSWPFPQLYQSWSHYRGLCKIVRYSILTHICISCSWLLCLAMPGGLVSDQNCPAHFFPQSSPAVTGICKLSKGAQYGSNMDFIISPLLSPVVLKLFFSCKPLLGPKTFLPPPSSHIPNAKQFVSLKITENVLEM